MGCRSIKLLLNMNFCFILQIMKEKGVPDTRFKVRHRTETLPDLLTAGPRLRPRPDRDFYNNFPSQYYVCPSPFKLSLKISVLLILNLEKLFRLIISCWPPPYGIRDRRIWTFLVILLSLISHTKLKYIKT